MLQSVFDRLDREFVAKVRKDPPFIKIPKPSLMCAVKDAITFSKKELLESVDISEHQLNNALIRLSEKIGNFPRIRNHDDFNHLYKTPIIEIDNLFLTPLFPTFCQAISETFYYDVIEKDPSYLPEFERRKGKVSEGRCFRYFAQAIPSDFLFPNPKFQDEKGEREIADLMLSLIHI